MVYVIDAVMGTGKSTSAFVHINKNPEKKFIVVLPGLDEATRYKKKISSDFNGKRAYVVALDKKKGFFRLRCGL
jgi:hypothetical protein